MTSAPPTSNPIVQNNEDGDTSNNYHSSSAIPTSNPVRLYNDKTFVKDYNVTTVFTLNGTVWLKVLPNQNTGVEAREKHFNGIIEAIKDQEIVFSYIPSGQHSVFARIYVRTQTFLKKILFFILLLFVISVVVFNKRCNTRVGFY